MQSIRFKVKLSYGAHVRCPRQQQQFMDLLDRAAVLSMFTCFII